MLSSKDLSGLDIFIERFAKNIGFPSKYVYLLRKLNILYDFTYDNLTNLIYELSSEEIINVTEHV